LDFLLDDYFQACLFGFLVQVVDVEDVVPEFVVLRLVVGLEVLVGLFEGFLFNATDEAFALFVLFYFIAFLPKFCKGINQDTSNNISKQHIHENSVNHIRDEPAQLKRFHILTDLFANIQFNDTVEQGLAVVFWYFLRVQGGGIVVNGEDGEDGYEGHA
jgi:hypothetical protein